MLAARSDPAIQRFRNCLAANGSPKIFAALSCGTSNPLLFREAASSVGGCLDTYPWAARMRESAQFVSLAQLTADGAYVTFTSFGLPIQILKGIRAAGLTEPTAIQSKAIPIILQGNDVIGIAESGSGKTGAYLMPILSRFLERSVRLRGIVLVPTRELAAYVETRARDYARFTDLKIGVVFTGAPLAGQERMLRE